MSCDIAYLWGLIEGGLTELVGVDEQVDQNEYGDEVGVDLSGGPLSGEILSMAFFTSSAAAQGLESIVYIFDDDPTTAAGDSDITAADLVKAIGKVSISPADWTGNSVAKMAYKRVDVPFHPVSTLYFVFQNLSATSLNDGAGDEDQIRMNFWYRRES